MKLQAKLTLILLPMVVTPLAALGWITHAHLVAHGQEEVLSHIEQSLHAADQAVRDLVESTRANVEVFAVSTLLERYAQTDDEWQRYTLLQPLLLESFRSYQRAHPAYFEIRFLLPDGYEDTRVTISRVPNLTEQEGAQDYFRRVSRAPNDLAMAFRKNPDDGRFVLSVLRRLRLPPRLQDPAEGALTVRGYLGITVSLQDLQNMANERQAKGRGEVRLIHGNGTEIVAPDAKAAKTGQKITPAQVVSAIEHIGEVIYADDGFIYKAHPTALGMYVVAGLPEDEMPFSTRLLAYEVAAVTLVSMLLAAWLLHGVLRRIVLTPIGMLRQATREIGNGNLTPAIPVQSKDELGELAASVAEMGHQLQQSGDHVEYLATHDQLTGLPNRTMFRDSLEHALRRAERQHQRIALLFLDIDNFKRVNDSYGHQYGDQLLIEFGERLGQCSRNSDLKAHNVLSRLGGDEFLIMLEDIGQPLDAGRVAQRILSTFKEPLSIGHHHYYVGTSIGISVYPDDGQDVDELIRNADLAMYQAKDLGKNNFQFFSRILHAKAAERIEMERRLRNALLGGEFFLLYQPQMDITSGRLVEAEALLRWNNGDNGVISPDSFIPVAEETGLINDIGEWVIREALSQKLAWARAGLGDVRIAVNVSSIQLRRGNLDKLFKDIFAAAPDATKGITIELTESALMENSEEGFRLLHELERMGFTISLDDFGTGYSSLSYLHSLPIHCLKIDRSFMVPLPRCNETRAIVSAIIAMAHSLGIIVVAEGVETEEQLAFLREQGCDRIQGYLYGKPMEADAVANGLQASGMKVLC